jgi:RimJ/RimL family protein N-acetyltransferase
MELQIREARISDIPEYTKLLQATYQESYVNENIGLTKDCFSEEIFASPDTQKYLATNLIVNDKQKCWLAFVDSQLVGSISIIERESDYELRGYYVESTYQGQGIGKRLWQLALNFVKDKDITCDIYAHNIKTIDMYKKWGFEVDTARGEFYRHWPEWPNGVQAKGIYMRYKVAKDKYTY